MKTCGIMVSKKTSHRFPGKNRLLFKENAEILLQCLGIGNVYMLSDDQKIIDECLLMDINIILKKRNIDDELSYLDVLRFAYYSIGIKYDIIVTILCNSIGHTVSNVMEGIERLKNDPDASEYRSFDKNGLQSGIFIFKADKLPEKWHHMGAFLSNGKEIHYIEELE